MAKKKIDKDIIDNNYRFVNTTLNNMNTFLGNNSLPNNCLFKTNPEKYVKENSLNNYNKN